MTYSETDDQIVSDTAINFEGLPKTVRSRSTLCIAKPGPLLATHFSFMLRVNMRIQTIAELS